MAEESTVVNESDTILVCEGEALSTLDASGQPLSRDELTVQIQMVQDTCDGGESRVQPFGFDYAYLAARVTYNSTTASIFFSSDASSIPSGLHTLSCTYRLEPTSGSAGVWHSCGTNSGPGSSLMTMTVSFCPVPGTRWHVMAGLYKGSGSSVTLKQRDDDYEIAV